MAFSADVVVTALQKFQKSMNTTDGKETIALYHPLLQMMVDGKTKNVLTGPFMEWRTTDKAPGKTTPINSSNEEIQGGRVQGGEELSEYMQAFIRAYDVPLKDLREVTGEADIGYIVKNYAVRDRIAWMEEIVQQIVMGNVPGLEGIFTWNGDRTYNPSKQGSRGGWFQFVDPDVQSGNVHGLTRNAVNGWHNQHREISSFAYDGRKTIRMAHHDTQIPGAMGKSADYAFADRASYENYLDAQETFIFRDADSIGKDPSKWNIREGVEVAPGLKMFMEPSIRLVDFTTPSATEGVIYGACSETQKLWTQGGAQNGGGWFTEEKPRRLPFQPLMRYETNLVIGGTCSSLQRNFTVTGGARE